MATLMTRPGNDALERKDWALVLEGLLLLGGVLGGGAIVWEIYNRTVRGVSRLTSSAVAALIDYFRGAETVLEERIAEQSALISALEQKLSRATDDLREMQAQLAEVRSARAEVAAEPVPDGETVIEKSGRIAWRSGAHGVYR